MTEDAKSGLNLIDGFTAVDFSKIVPVLCPCGLARRALQDDPRVPYSLHITEISTDAKTHYHRNTVETYIILECDTGASLEVDGHTIPVAPQSAVVIYPGARHRAVGKMKVVIIASPKFDPLDEWLD